MITCLSVGRSNGRRRPSQPRTECPSPWPLDRWISGSPLHIVQDLSSFTFTGKTPTPDAVIDLDDSNGGAVPPRLPVLSHVLTSINDDSSTLIAVSYRGYWTSKGRSSERGLVMDAEAAVRWAETMFPRRSCLVLWGQSLGAAVAARACQDAQADALVLETPFVSIESMLQALYPQKWLPYRHLGPFLWNHWNTERALRSIARGPQKPRVMICQAERDELVPMSQARRLRDVGVSLGLSIQLVVVSHALHNETSSRSSGRLAISRFIQDCGRPNKSDPD